MLVNLQSQNAYAYTGGKNFDPKLPCIVFLHGAQHDHSVWALQSRYFAHHGYSVLAVDLPGHNRSSGAPCNTVEEMAHWLATLLDSASVQGPVILVGHSMGSLIALCFAQHYPERTQALCLIGTAFPMQVSAALLDAAQNDVPKAIALVNQWSHSSLANKPSHPGPGAWLYGGNQRLMERVASNQSAPVFYIDFTACNQYQDGLAAAQSLQCPVLFILGKKDVMTPIRSGHQLASNIRNAKVVELNCGHAIMTEKPDETLNSLINFLKEISTLK